MAGKKELVSDMRIIISCLSSLAIEGAKKTHEISTLRHSKFLYADVEKYLGIAENRSKVTAMYDGDHKAVDELLEGAKKNFQYLQMELAAAIYKGLRKEYKNLDKKFSHLESLKEEKGEGREIKVTDFEQKFVPYLLREILEALNNAGAKDYEELAEKVNETYDEMLSFIANIRKYLASSNVERLLSGGSEVTSAKNR